jgi:DNA-binding transcriptional regulator LsrR (DeoR family)
MDPHAATVVRLRYFAGLTIDETASALGVSAPTVKRTWAFARASESAELSFAAQEPRNAMTSRASITPPPSKSVAQPHRVAG